MPHFFYPNANNTSDVFAGRSDAIPRHGKFIRLRMSSPPPIAMPYLKKWKRINTLQATRLDRRGADRFSRAPRNAVSTSVSCQPAGLKAKPVFHATYKDGPQCCSQENVLPWLCHQHNATDIRWEVLFPLTPGRKRRPKENARF